MSDRPLICGFLKVRNEIIREGNLYRALANLQQYCDTIVACDDASTDGTREALQSVIPADHLVLVPPDQQNFNHELVWKQRMLDIVHQIQPHWVFWADADEVMDVAGTAGLRVFAAEKLVAPEVAWRFHFTQLWRNTLWARTDLDFDAAAFIKLWRWSPDLSFEIVDRLHHHQFPIQLAGGLIGVAPFETIHYGNVGKNLVWKTLQYHDNPLSIQRHLHFDSATYRPVDQSVLPAGVESRPGPSPQPFSEDTKAAINALDGLHSLPRTFCIIIPAYNRAETLPMALTSVVSQTHRQWVAIVLDDGSTDETPTVMREWQERDPRIFYCHYPHHRGGVAMNEIGMTLACEMAEYWTRLGSDDWWGPKKLANDLAALANFEAVYGPYRVMRNGAGAEVCNPPRPPLVNQYMLHNLQFVASWANCAVRTAALARVRAKYGNFCDPRLVNMEDYLVNARIARETAGWVWRGVVNGQLVINPPTEQIVALGLAESPAVPQWFAAPGILDVDAVWVVAGDGASANMDQYLADERLTRQLIAEENRTVAPQS